MSVPDPYDLDFRPSSYWAPENAIETLLVNIKGERRRRAVRAMLEQGYAYVLATFLARNAIEEEERATLESIHPAFRGGEYLPDAGPEEVEIARVCLASTTMDVISVRAQRVSRGWRYRIVDEYGGIFHVRPASSRQPLRMRRLIRLMDTARKDDQVGITDAYRDANMNVFLEDGEPISELRRRVNDLEDFVTVTSAFYPQLGAWYEEEGHIWAIGTRTELTLREREEAASE